MSGSENDDGGPAVSDPRIVYGAGCCWWDSIDKVGHVGSLPVCPHCSSVLYETPSLEVWNDGVLRHAAKTADPAYVRFVAWLRGKCFRKYTEARAAFEAEEAKVRS